MSNKNVLASLCGPLFLAAAHTRSVGTDEFLSHPPQSRSFPKVEEEEKKSPPLQLSNFWRELLCLPTQPEKV